MNSKAHFLAHFKTPFYSLFFLLILLFSLFIFLVASTPGLFLSIKLASLLLPGQFDVEKPQGRLLDDFSCASLSYRQGKMTVTLSHFSFKWQWTSLLQGQLPARASWDKLSLSRGQIRILSAGRGSLRIEGKLPHLVVNGDLSARYFNQPMRISFNYQNQQMKGWLSLGKNHLVFSGSPPYPWQLKATIPEPQLLHPQLASLKTMIHADANLSAANTGEVLVKLQPGTYRLSKKNPLATLQFTGGQLRARFNLKKGWALQGSLHAQDQRLNLSGRGHFFPVLSGSLHINAPHFPLLETKEYQINLAPQLELIISPHSLDLKGSILVPSAEIRPQAFNNSLNLSSDAVLIGPKPAKPTHPLPVNTDILLVMGDQVALSVKGLRGFLQGSIHLRQSPQGSFNANGELTIRKGKYQAYGENLSVDQGELLFTDGLIDNPRINVRASRHFNNLSSSRANSSQLFNKALSSQAIDFDDNITVWVLITGRLKSTRTELFSDPSTLSQADILSLLILGKPAREANKAGGQLLLKAISSMNLGSGTRGLQLLKQLKDSLELDLSVQSNSKYNQKTNQVSETNSLVVGKSLSKRLYLSYNFGLAQANSNELTLTYLLNKFFSIQVNTSATENGIDLLYSRQKG